MTDSPVEKKLDAELATIYYILKGNSITSAKTVGENLLLVMNDEIIKFHVISGHIARFDGFEFVRINKTD